MKILHILDHSIPLHSGYTFRTKAILEQQQKLGWETFHVTSSKHPLGTASIEAVDGFTFYRSEKPAGLLATLPILNQWAHVQSLAKRLDEIIPGIKPDILHAHSPALNGLAALKVAKRHNIPVAYECRAFWEDAAVDHGTTTEGGLRYYLTKMLETYVFKQVDAITTICEGLRSDIVLRGIPAEKVTVIPNAVDLEQFTYGVEPDQALRAQLGLQNKIVLGFIGSFYAYEGLPLLLETLPKILANRPETRLLLVGGGPQEALIKQKTKELGLDGQVIFTGRIPHERVQDYYNQVDIFVYPRLSMRLTDLVTPLKPLEAMAQGRLVVASDVGGHKELIEHQRNGYLFKANDAEDLAATVLAVLNQTPQWEQIRLTGRLDVEQTRNWTNSVSFYKNVYAHLMTRS
ncbi:MAG: glycosyltransferase, exosortase A system-associated [Gammaproteobacteria bacterium]|nr:glycosyltransferase, exosortase A system-associated [Gammaproteobacteria bacterium]